MDKEKLKKKLRRHKTPSNLKLATEQKINAPILQQLSKYARMNDTDLKKIQGLMIKSVMAMSKVAKEILNLQHLKGEPEKQEIGQKLFEDTFDSLALAAQASYNINMKRVSWASR